MNALIEAYQAMRSTAQRIVTAARRIARGLLFTLRELLRTGLKAATGGYGTFGVVLVALCVLSMIVYGPAAFFSLLLSYALTALFSFAFVSLLDRVFSRRVYFG
jgi:hypothetical protein